MAIKLLNPSALQPKINKALEQAKATDKDKRINDGGGLYLLVKPTGSTWWRFDYAHNTKRKTLSLGIYPATGLANARRKAEDARAKVANDQDPSEERKQDKQAKKTDADNEKRKTQGLPLAGSFKEAAQDWLVFIQRKTREITHQKKAKRFELHVYPAIGDKLLNEVKSKDINDLLQPLIQSNKLETAHRIRAEISAVYAYAITHNRADYDPAQAPAKLMPSIIVKNRAAITDPRQIAALLKDMDHYQGTFTVQMALRFSPLVFQRPGEIRQMQWADVDMAAKEWRYFVTKTEVNHIVPLSRQALAILEAMHPVTGSGRYVFPSSRNDGRPMSDNTIRVALRTLGYDNDTMTPHGFRAMASTLLNEQGWTPDAIERQLCHMPKDKVRAAYNRAGYLDERRRMMQAWADYLDGLRNGADIIPFKRAS